MTRPLPVITNNSDISLEMAVWLLHDDYDHIKEENYISATGLMKPLRHIVLPSRIPPEQRIVPDVEEYIATAMGQSLHAAIEKAWVSGNHVIALKKLGYPDHIIERILVNPTPEQLASKPDAIVLYVEQRAFRKIEVNGKTFTVGGKFDMVCEGRVTDTKSTSVWSWVYGGRDEDYRLQGSIYRWLNPDKVTQDFIRINFIFTDWNKADAQSKADYPPRRVMHKDILLLSLEETEAWIRGKLNQISQHANVHEKHLPECTPEELWMSEPKYKYYANPANTTGRSTRNFDSLMEAQAFMAEKGKGTVITVPGAPKRCGYCPAFPVCTQKDKYTHD